MGRRVIRALVALLATALCPALAQADPGGYGALSEYCVSSFHPTDSGSYLNGMHSVSGDGDVYMVGVNEDNLLQLFCSTGDKLAVGLAVIQPDGKVNYRAVMTTDAETVTGDIEFDAADYRLGDLLEGFDYTSEQRQWRYENFNRRASDTFADMLRYVDVYIRHESNSLSLRDAGFTGLPEPDTGGKIITSADLAGIWLAVETDLRCGLYLAGDTALEWSWSSGENPVTLATLDGYREQLRSSKRLMLCEYDYILGTRRITAEYAQEGKSKADTLSRTAFYGEDGRLYMRTRSMHQGMGSAMDGLLFVKAESAPLWDAVHTTQAQAFTPWSDTDSDSSGQVSSSDSIPSVYGYQVVNDMDVVDCARLYIETMGISRQGLIEQLEFEGYGQGAAVYGADHCGADWNRQAVRSARAYRELFDFSRSEMIDQLMFDGYTRDQAAYGADHG